MVAGNRKRRYNTLLKIVVWPMLLASTAGVLCMLLPVNGSFAQPKLQEEAIEIFVTSNGLHTEFVMPLVTPHRNWFEKLPQRHFANADRSYTYVAFGWGDRCFYVESKHWRNLTLKTALAASFFPTPSVIHVTLVNRKPAITKQQRPLLLSPKQYRRLLAYLDVSFQQQQGSYRHIPQTGYTGHDTFYEANRNFYLTHNCNAWVNRGLKAIGIKTALWAPLPFAVMRYLR